jgi:hypothetical protein
MPRLPRISLVPRASALLLALLLSACQTPNLVVSDSLRQDTEVMEATGRQGWQLNQVIRFGDYITSRAKRGWMDRLTLAFIVKFEKAQQKLSFTQFGPDGRSADVYAVSKFRSTEVELLRGYLSYTPSYRNAFAGTVVASEGGPHWDFLIDDPEGGTFQPIDGIAQTQDGRLRLVIAPLRKVEGQANWLPIDNQGFEFRLDGRSVGAVSLLNNGRVWMRRDAPAEVRQLMAALSSALLLRHSLIER